MAGYRHNNIQWDQSIQKTETASLEIPNFGISMCINNYK